MKIYIEDSIPGVTVEEKRNYVIELADTHIPVGIPLDLIEAEGDLIVGLGAGQAMRLPGPTADNQLLTGDLAQAGLMVWKAQPTTNINTFYGGRVTLTSGAPISADVSGATGIYYTPYVSNLLSLYNGLQLETFEFSELLLTLNNPNHAAATAYDTFAWNDNGTIRHVSGPAWSNSGFGTGARGTGAGTTELERVKGIWVNKNEITVRNGASTYTMPARRGTYLGSFYTSAAGQTTKSEAARKFYLWNTYNRVEESMSVVDPTNSWTYTTAAWRYANANAANRFEILVGLSEDLLEAAATANQYGSGGAVGVGIDSNTANSSKITGGQVVPGSTNIMMTSFYRGRPAIGPHYIAWLEYYLSGAGTWYGDNGNVWQMGMVGSMKM